MTRHDEFFSGMGRPTLMDGHGESVTYTAPGGGAGSETTAVVIREEVSDHDESDGLVQRSMATVLLNTADVSPAIGGTVTFDSGDWRVIGLGVESGGVIPATVQRYSSTEKSLGNRMRRRF